MKLSTMGRYGLRILMDIAEHQHAGSVTLQSIAERQELSQKYLWHVITPMKNAGLINVARGAGGGYRLAREPKDISLLDILTAVEGKLCLVPCVHSESRCKRSPHCAAKKAWETVNDAISKSLKSLTLESIINKS
ncbi:MAG: Rrf2 family transcriptional regulator [bacterium]